MEAVITRTVTVRRVERQKEHSVVFMLAYQLLPYHIIAYYHTYPTRHTNLSIRHSAKANVLSLIGRLSMHGKSVGRSIGKEKPTVGVAVRYIECLINCAAPVKPPSSGDMPSFPSFCLTFIFADSLFTSTTPRALALCAYVCSHRSNNKASTYQQTATHVLRYFQRHPSPLPPHDAVLMKCREKEKFRSV